MKNKDIPIMLGVGDIPNKVAIGMKNILVGGKGNERPKTNCKIRPLQGMRIEVFIERSGKNDE